LNSIGFGILPAAFIAPILCLQVAIAHQGPSGDNALQPVQTPSAESKPEIDSRQTHRSRLRLWKLDPGGVATLHNKNHKTILHVIKGKLILHPQGMPELVLRAGVALAQDRDKSCRVQNIGNEPAQFIWQPVYRTLP
jgi:quercetin dioxygenase-like cupin family protein